MGQEKTLAGVTMYRVVFPDFWEKAYREKNPFYKKIEEHARMYVQIMHDGAEYLEGEKIQHFWHEHCEFCMAKAVTDEPSVFWCTKDMYRWVCDECFRAFKDKIGAAEASSDELFDQSPSPLTTNIQPEV